MKQMRYLLLLAGMILHSCRPDVGDSLLDRAEGCLETCADSTRQLLQQMNGIEDLPQEQQARYALLWTQAAHKCHLPLTDDSLINMAVEYYREIDNRHLLAKSLLYKGLVHKQKHQVEQATEAFVASEQAFQNVEDDRYKALLYNHYADLLIGQQLYDDALRCLKQTYNFERKGDSVHYVVSTCGQIARLYGMKEMPDSAETYYRQGKEYAELCQDNKRVRMFLQNYATFLIDLKRYSEAERMLKEAEEQADSTYIYNVYSALATLYYEMGQDKRAGLYATKALDSPDSLIQCVGYLHLYRIYKNMGEMELAVGFHDLYRQYHSDISQRRKTAEVAVIPHKQENLQLKQEKRAVSRLVWLWAAVAVGVVFVGIWLMRFFGRRHREQLKAMDALLDEKMKQLEGKVLQLDEVELQQSKIKSDLGSLKGVVTRQTKAIEGLKKMQKDMKTVHVNVVKGLKEEMKGLKEEQSETFRQMSGELGAQKKDLNRLRAQEKSLRKEVQTLVAELDNSQLLYRFLLDVGSVRPVLLILELKSGYRNSRYPIRHQEYAELLKQLAEYAHPGIREKIETDDVLKGKQEMACLIALGYDDVGMIRLATNLKPNSVRAYRTQVRTALNQ